MAVKTVGLDLAKDVFQVHGISETGRKIFNKKVKRAKLLAFFEILPPCMVGMEACGSAHFWARALRKLGHDVRLLPANYVKPYVKRGKTDAVDAEAITSLSKRHLEGDCPDIPDLANGSLGTLCDHLLGLNARIDSRNR